MYIVRGTQGEKSPARPRKWKFEPSGRQRVSRARYRRFSYPGSCSLLSCRPHPRACSATLRTKQ